MIVPVVIGSLLAWQQGSPFSWPLFALTLIGAIRRPMNWLPGEQRSRLAHRCFFMESYRLLPTAGWLWAALPVRSSAVCC
jgi:hypothetical protein